MVVGCVARRIESREATLGSRVSECVVALTVWGFEMVLRVVARLTASKEAVLGSRVSDCVVAFAVVGLGGGCIKLRWSEGASHG